MKNNNDIMKNKNIYKDLIIRILKTIKIINMIGYIYLLQEREFIKTKENIYKLGKSKQENLKRIQNYPNGTILII